MKKIISIFAILTVCISGSLLAENKGDTADELKKSFAKCDKDKDGKLTFKEFNIWPNHKNPQNPVKKFFFLDKNKDKYIALNEYRTFRSFKKNPTLPKDYDPNIK